MKLRLVNEDNVSQNVYVEGGDRILVVTDYKTEKPLFTIHKPKVAFKLESIEICGQVLAENPSMAIFEEKTFVFKK